MAAAGIRLHPACRVRQEKFGLLFYDSRGPRLLFAETGSLLSPDFFRGGSISDLQGSLSHGQREQVGKFLAQLLERGFIRE